jgi:hypothetical protein
MYVPALQFERCAEAAKKAYIAREGCDKSRDDEQSSLAASTVTGSDTSHSSAHGSRNKRSKNQRFDMVQSLSVDISGQGCFLVDVVNPTPIASPLMWTSRRRTRTMRDGIGRQSSGTRFVKLKCIPSLNIGERPEEASQLPERVDWPDA